VNSHLRARDGDGGRSGGEQHLGHGWQDGSKSLLQKFGGRPPRRGGKTLESFANFCTVQDFITELRFLLQVLTAFLVVRLLQVVVMAGCDF